MLFTRLLSVGSIICALGTASALAQVVEEDNSEITRPSEPAQAEQQAINLDRVEQMIAEQTNTLRKQSNLPRIQLDPQLRAASEEFAAYMARTGKYGHAADGRRPWERAKAQAYQPCIVTENIAYQYSSAGFADDELATKFVQGWHESSEHRKNMLDPDVTETAIAVARSDETGHYYAVQMFGRPRSLAIEFQVINRTGAEIVYTIGEHQYSLPPRYARTHRRCRPERVIVHWPGSEDPDADRQPITLKPNGGERYTLVRTKRGTFAVEKAKQG